jgi:hypothetical protein
MRKWAHNGHVNVVKVIEVRRGRDGKLYPPRMPTPPDERDLARRLAHTLVHRDGLPIRAAQRAMREQHGVRRSLGQVWKDLHSFTCPYCRQEAGVA